MSKEENETLAIKLLNSQDSKVAEAAKRIFSNTTLGTDVPKLAVKTIPSDSTMSQDSSDSVSREIQEAASAVVMLAPQHQNLIQIRQSGTSFGITPTVSVQPLESSATPLQNRRAATPSERVKRRYVIRFAHLSRVEGKPPSFLVFRFRARKTFASLSFVRADGFLLNEWRQASRDVIRTYVKDTIDDVLIPPTKKNDGKRSRWCLSFSAVV